MSGLTLCLEDAYQQAQVRRKIFLYELRYINDADICRNFIVVSIYEIPIYHTIHTGYD